MIYKKKLLYFFYKSFLCILIDTEHLFANFFFKVYALCFCSVSRITTRAKDASL